MELRRGDMVDHFQVLQLLGSGGTGEVYLARDTRLGRKVALKVIRRERLGAESLVARFYREARTTARFNHPHIVTIYAVGEHQGQPYLALEYLEGRTLEEDVHGRMLAVPEALRLALAVGEALEEAHRVGVVHGDLKPSNIIIPRDGRLRVLDFGIAKILGPTAEQESVNDPIGSSPGGRLHGTPQYMAPEQWRRSEISSATDVWAFGILLYELLAGRCPYEADSIVKIALQVCSEDPVPSIETFRSVPAEIKTLIHSCVTKAQERRPAMSDVVATLRELLLVPFDRKDGENVPFRGLLPFSENDAHLFFGRSTELWNFLERIRSEPVLTVVGPSGAGKSSFVLAGVIPRLQEQEPWLVIRHRPALRPFGSLAASLSTVGTTAGGLSAFGQVDGRETSLAEQLEAAPFMLGMVLRFLAEETKRKVLLVVDQLEEIVTLVDDESARRRFLEAVALAADDPKEPVRVVLTVRDDFLGRVAVSPIVRDALRSVVVLQTPEPAALEEILIRPLQAFGYEYDDPDLVEEMIDSVRGEAAALPLLQFAARMLWDERDQQHRCIRREAYDRMGGVAGALARHADGVLVGLVESDVALAREILLRLVTPERTRRVLSRDQLIDGLGPDAPRVLEHFTWSRLLVVRKARTEGGESTTFELAHESLIKAWKQLERWIDEDQENLEFLHEIGQAAELWNRRGRPTEEVWRGDALRNALQKAERSSRSVPHLVKEFLDASREVDARRTKLKRRAIVGLVAACMLVAVVAVAGSLSTTQARRRAESRHAEAQREGARAALVRGDLFEARAKLRGALETEDSVIARSIWAQLDRPLIWSKSVGSFASAVTFAPDGKTIAVAAHDKTVHLLDVQTRSGRSLRGHDDQVFAVAFSPAGDRLVASTRGGGMLLWKVETSEVERSVYGHSDQISSVEFSPDGKLIASASADTSVRIWSVENLDLIRTLETKDINSSAVFAPDGQHLAVGGHDAKIRIYEVASGKLVRTLKGHQGVVWGLAYSPRGGKLASASWDGTTRLWDLETGRVERTFDGGGGRVWKVAFSPEGSLLASGNERGRIRIWQLADGSLMNELTGHENEVLDVAFSPDGQLLASAGQDRTARLWRYTVREKVRVREGHDSEVYGLAFSPDGRRVASAAEKGEVRVFDVQSGDELAIHRTDTTGIIGVSYSADGRYLAFGGLDGRVQLIDLESGKRSLFEGHGGGIRGVRFSPNSELLASASADGTVKIWDVAARRLAVTLEHREEVQGVAFSTSGTHLVSACADGAVRVWDVAKGKLVKELRQHEDAVYGVAFAPDDRHIFSSGVDGRVVSWSYPQGTPDLLAMVDARLYWLSVSSIDHVATPASDGIVRIWRDGALTTLEGHHDEVNTIEFSPDGSLAGTGGDDGTTRLWHVDTGLPFWRTVALISNPPRALTHRGWRSLADDGAPSATSAWQRALQEHAKTSSERNGMLCVLTRESAIELWDIGQDENLGSATVRGAIRVIAMNDGCIVATRDRALMVEPQGRTTELAKDLAVKAIEWSGDRLLVASQNGIRVLDRSGRTIATFTGERGISALSAEGDRIFVGYEDGSIEIIRSGGRMLISEDAPSSAVLRIVPGPARTLVAGYADGFVGVWDPASGVLLDSIRLHGPVTHLLIDDNRVYAATDLGRVGDIDLRTLVMDECEVLRQVWNNVPVVWEQGQPVLRPRPSDHHCVAM